MSNPGKEKVIIVAEDESGGSGDADDNSMSQLTAKKMARKIVIVARGTLGLGPVYSDSSEEMISVTMAPLIKTLATLSPRVIRPGALGDSVRPGALCDSVRADALGDAVKPDALGDAVKPDALGDAASSSNANSSQRVKDLLAETHSHENIIDRILDLILIEDNAGAWSCCQSKGRNERVCYIYWSHWK